MTCTDQLLVYSGRAWMFATAWWSVKPTTPRDLTDVTLTATAIRRGEELPLTVTITDAVNGQFRFGAATALEAPVAEGIWSVLIEYEEGGVPGVLAKVPLRVDGVT